MSGQIFISYRRDDSSAWAGRLSDRLSSHFPSNQIFMDVDTIEPGIDFVEAIEESVGSCDVLIAVIGTRWLNSSNPAGKRRLEIPEDSVRVEISTALKRGIRVIPVLVEGATMPEAADLPDELKALVRRNALKLSHDRFRTESELLASTVGRVLENAEARHRELQERERLETERHETEEKERREAERRQKEEQEQLAAEQRQREETERINEGREREQREREKAEVCERQEEEQPDGRRRENEEHARLKVEALQRQSEVREQRKEETVPPIFETGLAGENATSPQPVGPAIVPSRSQPKRKWLPVAALALIIMIAGIWFATHQERTVRNFRTPVVSAETVGVLAKGVVTIHENHWCDLERGTEMPDGDLTWRNESGPVLVPSSGSGFALLKRKSDQEDFERITKMELSRHTFVNGEVIVAGPQKDTVHLQVGEVYSYLIKGRYYGKFLVESETPDLVISFVTYN
jgi:flagellar biosynthesis GTPase FlhF